MRRIHYGPVTLDVSDEVGDLIARVSKLAAEGEAYFTVMQGGAVRAQPYALGRVETITVSAYLDGGDENDVTISVGGSIPLAISRIPERDAPAGTEKTLASLRSIVEEYEGD